MEMPTGYDLLEHSHDFRLHLLKRMAAGLFDAAAVFIPITLAIYLIDLEPKELLAGVVSGFGWFFYAAVSESRTGTTLGKRLMGFIVASKDGPMTISQGVVRNVPKMFWYVFLPLDVFVGLSREGDPRQRWTDLISGTVVIQSK